MLMDTIETMELYVKFVKYDSDFLNKSWNWLTTEPIKELVDVPYFTRKQQKKWFKSLDDQKDYLIEGVKFLDIPIGVTGLKHITKDDAEYWGYIGETNYWGRGIGKLMVRHAIEKAQNMSIKRLYLKVIKTNQRAISLYEYFDFKEISSQNTDYLLFMELKL